MRKTTKKTTKKNVLKRRLFIAGVAIALVLFVSLLLFALFSLRHTEKKTSSFKAPPSWIKLTNQELGISVAVPPQVSVFHSKDDPAGCSLPLIFGVTDSSSSVFLMPAFTNCKKTMSLADSYAFSDSVAKKITVLPARNSAELRGILLSHVVSNRLSFSYNTSPGCVLSSFDIEVDRHGSEADGATVPVTLKTSPECPIDPHTIFAQYSSKAKKVVIFESEYGWTEGGDFYTPENEHTSVDFTMYKSTTVR
jgi:hypothetical protein